MDRSYRLHLLRASALAGVALSVALLTDGARPGPWLCGFASECDLVRRSALGAPLGVPLPAVGVVAFGALFGLSLTPGLVAGRVLRPLAAVAGLGGAALLGVQFFILDHLCPYCLLIDGLALVVACLALAGGRGEPLPQVGPRARAGWVGAAALAAVAGVLGPIAARVGGGEVPVPPQVSALWVPGKVTVVEIYDFECPHCRRLHPVLKAFLAEQGDRVHHVRLTVPMPAHRQARHGSRAFLCAAAQGKGAEMAERLIVADRLDPESCERAAAALGLSVPAYRTCVSDPATDGRLDADLAWVKEAHPKGLPVVWVQDQALSGLRPPGALGELRGAVREARRRLGLPPGE